VAQRGHGLERRTKPVVGKTGRGLASGRCGEAPSPELICGLEQFNRREFYACHETLEELWLREADPVRYLYQGILQIGVGYHHLLGSNYRGAVNLLRRGLKRLEPFEPRCLGVEVAELRQSSAAVLADLTARGNLEGIDASRIPRVGYTADVQS